MKGLAGGIDSARRPWLAPLVLLAAMTAWLWPIGVGGRMPVGGDVTQFSLGLMAVLGRALRSGRLPFWNDLWGFGFPGLAESQMGVYYPPHLALYGGLSTEAAYAASLVLHTYWAAIGGYWAGRKFGISPWGSAISGFSWAASGPFLVHLPHQWGYTTASWMPWILGLGWIVARGGGSLRTVAILAAAMTLQVLPGHFQFAFMTQVAVFGLALWSMAERPEGGRAAIRAASALIAALLAVLPLAAMQLWPTLQLARSAGSQRTFEYLSAFPASPVHLVNYVAPNLFHGSPLWRSFAWDPFHAMPEEHRPYLGLVPLMLALGTIRREFLRDPGTRFLSAIALVSLLLSLGPYVPGFRLLILLPGFSFFRAPTRWGLLTGLALAILAGRGFDSWRGWPRVGLGAARFLGLAAVAATAVVAGVLLALDAEKVPEVRRSFEAAARLLPWPGDPSFGRVVASARSGPTDPLVLAALIREGVEPVAASRMTLDRERSAILAREIGEMGLMLALLAAIVPFLARRSPVAPALLVMLTFADLLILSRHRGVELAPIRPLTRQSAVLGRLAEMPRGSRSIDGLRNLPMVAGAAPVAAYRTLDRPALSRLVALAGSARDGSVPLDRIDAATRAVGASIRVFDVFEPSGAVVETIVDPALASWMYGRWAERTPSASKFRIRAGTEAPSRAWFVPGMVPDGRISDDPSTVLRILDRARPVPLKAVDPEHFEVEVNAETAGAVVVSVLADEEWAVAAKSPAGREGAIGPAPIPIFSAAEGGGAWQSVAVPAPGRWRLLWSYRARAAKFGLAISALSWGVWFLVLIATGRKGRERTPPSIPSL